VGSNTAVQQWLWAILTEVWWTLWFFPWYHVLDIGLMTFLVYQVYTRLSGTRAMRIVAGIAVLGLGYLAAHSAGLFLTSWLLGGVWAAALVFVIVIFQGEIRHMLEQINPRLPTRMLWRWTSRVRLPEERLVALTETVFRLASRRCGALVIFERDDPVEPLLKSPGTVLDAQLSPELLETVFAPPTPLHDGALYIRGGRAYRAACVLPLSENQRLAYFYGTRHRAALGISEQADTLAVVVSEERGKVSVVEKGTIHVVESSVELLAWLDERLTTPEEKPRRHRAVTAILTHNWRPKLVSLAAVGLLWFAFVGVQNAEIGLSLPVVYVNVPKKLTIEGKQVQEVFVRVRGSREMLNFLDASQLQVAINLKDSSAGRYRYSISENDINLPPGLRLVTINPSVIILSIDEKPPESKNNKR
jgi:diadenylate cyclase